MYVSGSVKEVQVGLLSKSFLLINGSLILILGLFPDVVFDPITRLVQFSIYTN